jgi:hypothetical protein
MRFHDVGENDPEGVRRSRDETRVSEFKVVARSHRRVHIIIDGNDQHFKVTLLGRKRPTNERIVHCRNWKGPGSPNDTDGSRL